MVWMAKRWKRLALPWHAWMPLMKAPPPPGVHKDHTNEDRESLAIKPGSEDVGKLADDTESLVGLLLVGLHLHSNFKG